MCGSSRHPRRCHSIGVNHSTCIRRSPVRKTNRTSSRRSQRLAWHRDPVRLDRKVMVKTGTRLLPSRTTCTDNQPGLSRRKGWAVRTTSFQMVARPGPCLRNQAQVWLSPTECRGLSTHRPCPMALPRYVTCRAQRGIRGRFTKRGRLPRCLCRVTPLLALQGSCVQRVQ